MATVDPFASAIELRAALVAGRVTSTELTELYIGRIERHDARLNAVVVRDMIFGMTHKNSGQFFLLDPKTGKTLWTSEPRQATNAAIVGAGDLAFALKDSAELLVGRPDATGFQVLKTYTVADSSTWAQPVLAGNRIFVKDETKVTLFTFN